MPPHPDHAAWRFEMFAREVLAPAAIRTIRTLDVASHQSDDPLPWSEATTQPFHAVRPGWRWGPVWSTTWFRVRGTVPPDLTGIPLLLFDCGTEALLWRDGVPARGLGPNHAWAPIAATPDQPFELFVEAACNLPLGATTFWWDERELESRWRESEPGRLAVCALGALDPRVWRLWQRYDHARRLLTILPPDTMRYRHVAAHLDAVTDAIDDRDPLASAAETLARLDGALAPDPGRASTRCIAVGHAHIDTGWLWPMRETVRKCMRSWATALDLMEREPRFTFTATQPQQYEWVRQANPPLFDAIRSRVADGRWEASGAMWVEPDCLLVSGESLVRQITQAARWQRSHLGVAPPRTLFLPDSFGFPACLPAIMRAAGLDTFITNKLAWNEVNTFPYSSFLWIAPDGSAVRAHAMPGQEYNVALEPHELARGERRAVQDEAAPACPWLQPYGFGDGGGGPTPEMLERLVAPPQAAGLPIVESGNIESFRAALAREWDPADGGERGTWRGPLDLEMHRGTLTTQAWIKEANVAAESGLRRVEWLAAAEGADPDLTDAWRNVLLHQFHDILPGTSIGAVYDRARTDHDGVATTTRDATDALADQWASRVAHAGTTPVLVFNPCTHERSGVVELDGRPCLADAIPGLGARVVDAGAGSSAATVRLDGLTLSNGMVTASLDETGRLTHLRAEGHDNVIDGAAGAHVRLYEDRPRRWEAWDIDAEYARKPVDVGTGEVIETRGDGTCRGEIVVRRRTQATSIEEIWRLDAASRRLDVITRVEWGERHRLLRAEVPLAFDAPIATCGGPLGYVERPTHRNTAWERARFEVPASGWIDLSRPGLGLSLLAPARFGFSIAPNRLGVSLLRGTTFPDPDADMGDHTFTWSLLPHGGDWRRAGTAHEREALRHALSTRPVPPTATGERGSSWAPVSLAVEPPASVVVTALKPSDDDAGRLVLRVSETHGAAGVLRVRWNLPIVDVVEADVHERPLPGYEPQPAPETVVALRAHGLHTLVATRRGDA